MGYDIIMSKDAWDYFQALTDLAQGEVACFGYAHLHEKYEEIYVPEIFLVPQESDPNQVDFVTEGFPYAIEKALADGKDPADLRFIIHSHYTYPANWSSTDEDAITKIGNAGCDWLVSAIFNRKKETAARIDSFTLPPFGRLHVKMKDLKITYERDFDFEGELIDDLERFVKKPEKKPDNKGKKSVMSPAAAQHAAASLDDQAWEDAAWAEYEDYLKDHDASKSVTDLSLDELIALAKELDWTKVEETDTGNVYFFDNTGIVAVHLPNKEQKQLPVRTQA